MTCAYTQERSQHIEHLQINFEKCRVYYICLNPDKCIFMVRQGKILGHIVYKNDISINFEKIKIIVKLPRLRNARLYGAWRIVLTSYLYVPRLFMDYS